ncbi:hypothetical protein, partial [Mucilaginibacter sp.]
MPQQIGKKVGVNAAELVPWYSYDALKKVIWRHKENTYGIKRLNRSSPGHQMLVDFDTLPPHIQDCLGDPRKVDHILLKYYKEDGEAVRFYSTYQFENGETLDMKYQERYIVNASVLKAAILLNLARIDMRRSMKGNLKRKKDINGNTTVPSIGDALHNDVQSFNQALKAKFNIEHSLPASERHFKRVLNDFETQGYISLISDKHGNQNTRKVTDETLSLLQSLFAGRSKKPNATEVHREYKVFLNGYIEVINNASGEVYNPADFKKLSDTTVKKYMASWQSKIGTYAIRSGNRQTLMQQFKPHHSLDKPKYAGSIISIDDRQPPFKMADGKRVWFYNGIDLGSEAFTCWVHGSTKEGIILEFYRQLVRNYAQWGFSLPAELEAEASL